MAEIAAATGFDYSLAFVAGFLGSGHCLGMCGALVSGYFMKAGKNKSYLPYFAYQFTRISVYTVVGVLAAALGVVLVSMAFVVTGCLAMAGAIWQHRRVLRRLRREEYTYREEPSIALATAVLLGLIGVMALVMLVVGAINR